MIFHIQFGQIRYALIINRNSARRAELNKSVLSPFASFASFAVNSTRRLTQVVNRR
jgi:hypothetical protein